MTIIYLRYLHRKINDYFVAKFSEVFGIVFIMMTLFGVLGILTVNDGNRYSEYTCNICFIF